MDNIYKPPQSPLQRCYVGSKVCPFCQVDLKPKGLKISGVLYRIRCRNCQHVLRYRFLGLLILPFNLLDLFIVMALLLEGIVFAERYSWFYLIPVFLLLLLVHGLLTTINKWILIKYGRIVHYR